MTAENPHTLAHHLTDPKEVIVPYTPIGIFIDDDSHIITKWTETFSIPNFSCIAPTIPTGLTSFYKKDRRQINQILVDMLYQLTPEQLKAATLVVVDQFYDNNIMRKSAGLFLNRLKRLNPTAHIVETSADPVDQRFSGSNATLDFDDAQALRLLLKQMEPNPQLRIRAFQHFSRQAYLQAEIADKLSDHPLYDSDTMLRKLTWRPEFTAILEFLRYDSTLFKNKFKQLDKEERRMFLHHAWNIIGHLEVGNPEGYYTGSLTRVTALLY